MACEDDEDDEDDEAGTAEAAADGVNAAESMEKCISADTGTVDDESAPDDPYSLRAPMSGDVMV